MALGDQPRNVKSKPTKLATPPHQSDVFTEEVGQAGGSGDSTPSSKGSSLLADFVVNMGHVFSFLIADYLSYAHNLTSFVILFGQNSA